MKCIIAGGRHINDYEIVHRAICDSGFVVTEAVCGCAAGVDRLGQMWAKFNGVPIKAFPPDWDTYGKAAGPIRNEQMAEYADALILIWDGKSKGSANMLKQAQLRGLQIYQHIVGVTPAGLREGGE